MTYEYVCEACGHLWEAEQSISEKPLKKCAACGKNHAKRLVSGGAGFLLKGGGWYADGYGSRASSKPSSSSDGDAAPAKATTSEKAAPSKKSDQSAA
jgi:putative FmdB family regulatory protein